MEKKEVRTRFAPSPTGFMHIGNLRSALYGYLFVKKHNGQMILRIEDTDVERYVKGAVEVIYKTCDEAGVIFDEGPREGGPYGPYVQSERKPIYLEHAKKLVEQGDAYYCFCDKERLETVTFMGTKRYDKHCLSLSKEEVQRRLDAGESYVIRQNIPIEGESSYTDLVFGEITVPNKDMEDNILIKSDGMPTYNFAHVVDDHLMHVTYVIRGNEYLSSTPKYNLLYDAFGWEKPQYIHLTQIMKDETRKLSKRHGDANFDDFIRKGYLPHAIVNYIALLGWSPKGTQEKFTMQELIENFSVEGLSKSNSIFDEKKMAWLNGEYIKELSFEEFYKYALPYFEKSSIKGRYDYEPFARLLQSRIEIFSEIPEKVKFIDEYQRFPSEKYENQRFKIDQELAYKILKNYLEKAEKNDYTEDVWKELVKEVADLYQLKQGAVYSTMRWAISGVDVTPGGFVEIAVILGKEKSIERLKQSLAWLKEDLGK